MLPTTGELLTTSLEIVIQPSKQYKMNLETGKINGFCDGLDAVRQSVYKILNTERYEYIIYSWNYGIELVDLYGKPTDMVCPELVRRISDALTVDSRITGVDNFTFDLSKKKQISSTFTVHTIFGDVDGEKVVNI